MKTSVTLFVLMSGVLSGSVHAAAKTEDQPAIVVSVENQGPRSNSNYAGPLDFPLQPQIYTYDIGIRAGSTICRASYASAFDYLPAVPGSLRPQSPNPGQSRRSRDVCDCSRRPCGANGYRESQRPLGCLLPIARNWSSRLTTLSRKRNSGTAERPLERCRA